MKGGLACYLTLRDRVDGFFSRVRRRHSCHISCAPGCSFCCQVHLTLFPVEADNLQLALERLPEEQLRELQRRLRHRPESCPLLVDRLCAVYQERPIICRTHGIPVQVREGPEVLRDVCPLNFPEGDSPAEAILDLDRLNTALAAVNIYYCKERGVDPGARVSVAEILKRARPGGDSS